jgi:hypothetical protein
MNAKTAIIASSGETDLARLLAGLSPVVASRPRAIRTQASDVPAPSGAIMLFREEEGVTVIVESDPADQESGGDEPLWAQITIRIHSSLDAVGMMAAISTALTQRDIPCNAVSAYYHDHLFVPWSRRDDALAALVELSKETSA